MNGSLFHVNAFTGGGVQLLPVTFFVSWNFILFLTVCGTVFADTVMVILPQVKAEVLACLSPAIPFLGWDRSNISCVCVCVHRFVCVCVGG